MLSALMDDLKEHSYCLAGSRPPQNYKTVVTDKVCVYFKNSIQFHVWLQDLNRNPDSSLKTLLSDVRSYFTASALS